MTTRNKVRLATGMCPKCKTAALAVVTVSSDVSGMVCPSCEGAWVRRDSLENLAASSGVRKKGVRFFPTPSMRDRIQCDCPDCKGPMKKVSSSEGATIDVCEAHGAFFDKNEIQRVFGKRTDMASLGFSSKKETIEEPSARKDPAFAGSSFSSGGSSSSNAMFAGDAAEAVVELGFEAAARAMASGVVRAVEGTAPAAAELASGAAESASGLAELAGGAVEVAGSMAGGAVEAAGAVAEVGGALVGGIFEALGSF